MSSNLSDILRRERMNRGYSLRVAAEKIGISHSYLKSLESGTDPRSGLPLIPSKAVIAKICLAYQLDDKEVSELLFSFEREEDFYIYMANRLHALKANDPAKYMKMLNIVMGKNEK